MPFDHDSNLQSSKVAGINAVLAMVYLALASFANYCLLQRDDRVQFAKRSAKANLASRNSNNGGRTLSGLDRKGAVGTTAATSLLSGSHHPGGGGPGGMMIHYGSRSPTPSVSPQVSMLNYQPTSVPAASPTSISERRWSSAPTTYPEIGAPLAAEGGGRPLHFPPSDADSSSDDDYDEVAAAADFVARRRLLGAPPPSSSSDRGAATQSNASFISEAPPTQQATDFLTRYALSGGSGSGAVDHSGKQFRRFFKSYTNMFADRRSYFFLAVICSSLIAATTILIFTFADVESAATSSSRRAQDLITVPQAASLFVVFAVLLHILHALFEQQDASLESESTPTCVRRFRVSFLITAVIGSYLVAGITSVSYRGVEITAIAPEIASSMLELLLGGAFLHAAITLPRKILLFGSELSHTAAKVRRLCLFVCAALVTRFVIYFPKMQDTYGDLGPFVQALFSFVDIVPLAISLVFLHSR